MSGYRYRSRSRLKVCGRRAGAALACSGTLVLVFAGFSAAASGAGRAQFSATDLDCTGTEAATYSPGIHATAQRVTVTASHTFRSCQSASDPALTSGSDRLTLQDTISCTALSTDARAGTLTFSWNNGRTSTLDYRNFSTPPAGTTIIYRGTITAGEFSGDEASLIISPTFLDPDTCDSPPGVLSSSFGAVLHIVNLTAPSPTSAARPLPLASPQQGTLPITGSGLPLPLAALGATLLILGAMLALGSRSGSRRPGA